MRIAVHKLIPAMLILTLAVPSGGQQTQPALSKRELAVKVKADHLAQGAPISVVRSHEEGEFGTFVSNNQEGFTFYDVDQKAEVILRYAEVRKIKDGYGGCNSLRERHTDRTKALVIVALAAVALGALIGAAAAAKN